MLNSEEGRHKVFISYSHTDSGWLERLQIHLRDLERRGLVELWNDTKIRPGVEWRKEVRNALDSARAAVLLISADFIASDFIAEEELPPLLSAAENDGVTILPLILSPSRFEKIEGLAKFQSVNPPSKPLIDLSKGEQERYLVKLTMAVLYALEPAKRESTDANEPRTGPLTVAPVSRGLHALGDLIQHGAVRESVFTFRFRFENACQQIELLGTYKDLHDLLHTLQLHCYDRIIQEMRSFPGDDLTRDNLLDHEMTLQNRWPPY